jgi:DNA-binding response OmpR family regulator
VCTPGVRNSNRLNLFLRSSRKQRANDKFRTDLDWLPKRGLGERSRCYTQERFGATPLWVSVMPETSETRRRLRFGAFELDVATGELRKQGFRIAFQEQPFRVLTILLAHPGEVVTREELRQCVWPGHNCGDFDHGLNTAVSKIR